MNVANLVRNKIANLADRTAIRVAELRREIPAATDDAIDQAFSRLARGGELMRISKGVYWKTVRGRFGLVPPKGLEAAFAVVANKTPGPAGPTAAAFLGLTTQVPTRQDVAFLGQAAVKLPGVVFHTRGNAKRLPLTPVEVAVLEIGRDNCRYCEPPKGEVVNCLGRMVQAGTIDIDRLRAAAAGEARRVQEFVALIA